MEIQGVCPMKIRTYCGELSVTRIENFVVAYRRRLRIEIQSY
jgi:hypothetical protein